MRLLITLDGITEPLSVLADQRDLDGWELYASKNQLPVIPSTDKGSAFPVNRWLRFQGWHAARRTGAYTGTWEAFNAACSQVDPEDDEDDSDDERTGPGELPDPGRPDPGTVSAASS